MHPPPERTETAGHVIISQNSTSNWLRELDSLSNLLGDSELANQYPSPSSEGLDANTSPNSQRWPLKVHPS